MTYILIFTFILFSGVGSMILTWAYIRAMNKRKDVCCHHKPQHVHSSQPYYSYFECKSCGERSVKSSESIYAAEDQGVFINAPWLAGHERVL